MNQRLIFLDKVRLLVIADRLDRGRRDPRLFGQRGMREPFVLRAPEAGCGDDRQLRETVGQGSAPTQMLTELCRMLTNLGRADQELERPAEPAPPSGNNQIVY